jgi:putative PIN family toxin of toxin-antitoxin system
VGCIGTSSYFGGGGHVRPLASSEITDEYPRVLAYPKFELSKEDINYLLYREILPYFEIVTVQRGCVIVRKDLSDHMFIRCAVAGKAEIIISGDRHLLALKS